jgi:hypothetical protein
MQFVRVRAALRIEHEMWWCATLHRHDDRSRARELFDFVRQI